MFKHLQDFGKFALLTGLLVIWAGAGMLNFSASVKATNKTLHTARFPGNHFYAGAAAEPITQTFDVAGVQRSALVYASSAPPPKAGAPLIFAFHGHGGNSQFSARKFLFHKEWPEALVIYPQGLPAPGKFDPEGKKNGWQKQVGDLADRDLKFFDAMLEWAKKQHRIDASRIYVAGHSNGGAMSYVLWAARSQVIAAFAPCAAGFGRNGLSAKAKPAILLAGEQDEVVPFENQKRSMNFVLRLNQCDAGGSARSKELTFYKSKVGADVMAYIYPGAHPLPDNAGEVIVKFFKEYSLK
jgi:polyhydroxybutyrate depolymerase